METNGLTRLSTPMLEETFFSDFMHVGLLREIIVNIKLKDLL